MERDVRRELDLVGSIYDAALDPAGWASVIDDIRRYVDLHLGAIAINYLPSGAHIQATTNIPPHYVQVMSETADSVGALWGGPTALARVPLEEPLRMLDHTRPEWWAGNPFYERFVLPQGLADQLTLILEFSPALVATFSLGRHESMPPISDQQVDLFRDLAPHLRRAALISNLLEARAMAAATFESALGALNSAALLVDADSRIIYANERAEALLRAADPIAQADGRLEVPRELVKGQLANAIAAAGSPREALGPASGIPVRRTDGTGAIVHVMPLERRADRPRTRAVAGVFVAEPNPTINLPLEGIRALYDLRPAEARVLQLIASGLSGRAVAEALGVSESTTKTHTVRLFDKLGVHTRAELVRFARDMSVGV